VEITVGASKWSRRALDAMAVGGAVRLIASGWRARRLKRHLPRLMSSTENPAISDLIVLFGFNMLYYQAKSRSYEVTMIDNEDERVAIVFTPPERAKGPTH